MNLSSGDENAGFVGEASDMVCSDDAARLDGVSNTVDMMVDRGCGCGMLKG